MGIGTKPDDQTRNVRKKWNVPKLKSRKLGMVLLSNLYAAHKTVCCPFLGNFCQAFLWQTINNGTNWQLKMRSECIPFKWKTATYFKINLLKSAFKSRFGSFCFRRRMFNDYLMTVWWLPDDCLMTAWWLPDDCLMTAWWLPDDYLIIFGFIRFVMNCELPNFPRHCVQLKPQWRKQRPASIDGKCRKTRPKGLQSHQIKVTLIGYCHA